MCLGQGSLKSRLEWKLLEIWLEGWQNMNVRGFKSHTLCTSRKNYTFLWTNREDFWKRGKHTCGYRLQSSIMPGSFHTKYVQKARARCKQISERRKLIGVSAVRLSGKACVHSILSAWVPHPAPEKEKRMIVRYVRDSKRRTRMLESHKQNRYWQPELYGGMWPSVSIWGSSPLKQCNWNHKVMSQKKKENFL